MFTSLLALPELIKSLPLETHLLFNVFINFMCFYVVVEVL